MENTAIKDALALFIDRCQPEAEHHGVQGEQRKVHALLAGTLDKPKWNMLRRPNSTGDHRGNGER